jgi:hypothetical protein
MSQNDRIKDLLGPNERILWEDRVETVGTRSSGVTLWGHLFEGWGVLVLFLCLGAGALLLSSHLPGAWMTIIALIGLSMLGLSAFLVRGMWRDHRFFRSAQLDYVLTNQRLIASNQTDQWSAQVFPHGLAGLARTGRNLELYFKEPDEPLTLYDLADVDAAEAIIAKTLGPLS